MNRRLCAICLSLLLIAVLLPAQVRAVTPIDPDRDASLTLHYRHHDAPCEGLQISTYRVARVYPDGTYELTGDFAGYGVDIYGVTSQEEWNVIADTLSACAAADEIAPTCTGYTDENGVAAFENILPGMYLTLSARAEVETGTLVFGQFLTVVPYPQEDGDHDYHVTVYPKPVAHIPGADPVAYNVVKQWRDSGSEHRPLSVTVEILKDGVLQSAQILSAENQWSYQWTAPDDGAQWQVVERPVPEGYSVSVVNRENTFIVTNTYTEIDDTSPETGDTIVLWPYVLGMCLAGGLIVALAVWRKREAE